MATETEQPVTAERPVLVRVEDGVARITLNRPQRRNALSLELMQELTGALRSAGDDSEVRAIVVGARASRSPAAMTSARWSDGTGGLSAAVRRVHRADADDPQRAPACDRAGARCCHGRGLSAGRDLRSGGGGGGGASSERRECASGCFAPPRWCRYHVRWAESGRWRCCSPASWSMRPPRWSGAW